MAHTKDMAMQELRFSIRKLLNLAAGGMLLSMGALLIPLDRNIAAGGTAGLWSGLLYEIGPTGRWAFALASMGFFLFGSLRLIMVAAGDPVALRSDENGIFVRTIRKQRQMPWRDVLLIDMSSTTVRRRTRRSVRIRIRDGDGEKSLLAPISLLSADEDEVATWIAEARRIQAESQARRKNPRVTSTRFGFGRRTMPTAP